MAKALFGHLQTDPRAGRLVTDNARLRARVADLEALVLRLKDENDRLTAVQAASLLDEDALSEMQPA